MGRSSEQEHLYGILEGEQVVSKVWDEGKGCAVKGTVQGPLTFKDAPKRNQKEIQRLVAETGSRSPARRAGTAPGAVSEPPLQAL